jgi:peptide subunit release factor 1 (eRF1)
VNVLSTENIRFYSCQIATSNSVKQHKLRKRIAYLSAKEGRGKEFISLYIPPTLSLEGVVVNLKKEAESATPKFENVGVRERFQASLKNLILGTLCGNTR